MSKRKIEKYKQEKKKERTLHENNGRKKQQRRNRKREEIIEEEVKRHLEKLKKNKTQREDESRNKERSFRTSLHFYKTLETVTFGTTKCMVMCFPSEFFQHPSSTKEFH